MCGLVLVVSSTTLGVTQQKIFKDMLQMDVVRGKHSTGIFAADKTGVDHFKNTMLPTDFLEHRVVTGMITSANVLAGHNRHATRGGTSSVNAHPFEHGHITLMHNGTLDTFPKLPDQDAFDTDSECIAYNLAKTKTQEDVIALLEKLEGAYALIWYDVIDDCVYVARNSERTLFVAQNDKALYMGSERGILFAALDRADLSLTGTRTGKAIDLSIITEVPTGELWCIKYKTALEVTKTPFTPKAKPAYEPYTYTNRYLPKTTTPQNNVTKTEDYTSELKKWTGLASGTWVDGVVVTLGHTKNHKGEIVGVCADVWCEQGFLAKLYQAHDLRIGDEVELTADALYMTLFDNAKAKDVSEMTITSRNYKKIIAKSVADANKQRKCSNCDGFYAESDGFVLSNNEFICDGCLSHDYTVRDYASNIGYME